MTTEVGNDLLRGRRRTKREAWGRGLQNVERERRAPVRENASHVDRHSFVCVLAGAANGAAAITKEDRIHGYDYGFQGRVHFGV